MEEIGIYKIFLQTNYCAVTLHINVNLVMLKIQLLWNFTGLFKCCNVSFELFIFKWKLLLGQQHSKQFRWMKKTRNEFTFSNSNSLSRNTYKSINCLKKKNDIDLLSPLLFLSKAFHVATKLLTPTPTSVALLIWTPKSYNMKVCSLHIQSNSVTTNSSGPTTFVRYNWSSL